MPSRRQEPSDDDAFMSMWGVIEPSFRVRLHRWGIDPEAARDLTQEVLARIVSARQVRGEVSRTSRELQRFAERTAINIIRDRLRAERGRPAEDLVADEEPVPAIDAEERGVLRETIREKVSGLSAHDREALALILRGGPYTGTETSKMSRARPRLLTAFEDLLGAAVVPSLLRLRTRMAELRAHVAVPIPAVTGALMGAAMSVIPPTGPTAAEAPLRDAVLTAARWDAAQAVPAVVGREAGSAPRPTPDGRSGYGRTAVDDATAARPSFPIATRVHVGGNKADDGRAEVAVSWFDALPSGSASVPVRVHCDHAVGKAACESAALLPSPP